MHCCLQAPSVAVWIVMCFDERMRPLSQKEHNSQDGKYGLRDKQCYA